MSEKYNKKVSVIDYGIGNISNLLAAIHYCGVNAKVVTHYQDIKKSDYIILPGVGAFQYAINQLNNKNMTETIINHINSSKPYLGICLGMQLMLQKSYEFGEFNGLGVIQGEVISIRSQQVNNDNYKVPHIGWNKLIEKISDNTLLTDSFNNKHMYFVHSYFANCFDQNNIIATVNYNNICIPAIIRHNNSFGCQFHPEKSGPDGLNVLKNFLNA